ncbi:NAD(P)-binding domain-containing protein [Cribrihabitans pelagius]|uniref:NAD(P)-binding domain-containing protein n=1 Tax=Cribrihabitans pelagius TaxID=1765746 RepID=UPI003B5982E4
MRLGFIGCGTISSAVVRGLGGKGHEILVSERGRVHSAALAAECPEVTVAGNQPVADGSDVVFLGLMAGQAAEVLGGLTFREGQQVISFMAGLALDEVAQLVAPARAAAIVLPFPAIARGGSPVLVLGDAVLAEGIFAPDNTVFALKDAGELDAYLCAQAVLSPVAGLLAQAGHWLGTRVEDAAKGETFLRMLAATSLADSTAEDLIAALNTPGGYNQLLRVHMEAAGLGAELASGLDRLSGRG